MADTALADHTVQYSNPTDLAHDVNLISSGISDKRHKGYDPTAFPQVSSERFLELKNAFSRYDKDMVGYIPTNRLADVMFFLNKEQLNERDIRHMKDTADPNGKGIITFSKFVILSEINRNPLMNVDYESDAKEREKAFSLFEHDGTGFVRFSNLFNALDYLGIKASKEDLSAAVIFLKVKHEGKLIDYNDFGKIIDFIEKKEEEKEITVTPDMIEEIREVFLVFDDQKTGSVDLNELPLALKCLKLNVPEEQLKESLNEIEIEGDMIRYQHFLRLVEKALKTNIIPRTENKLTEDERQELREAFSLFDIDGDGTISINELRNVMQSLGKKLSYKKLKKLLDSADADGNGFIDFEELVTLMEQHSIPHSFLDEMKKAFGHFDKDGNGYISPEELRSALERMKIRMSKVQFLSMLRRVDTNKDGQVSFKEFVVMMLQDSNI